MALNVGTKAPDFTLSSKGKEGLTQITLSDRFGKGNTLLLFFPMAFTSTCTTEMCGVSMDLSAYASLNAVVYGISGDNPFAQEAWAKQEKITVSLLSDYEHKIARAYDVAYDSFLPEVCISAWAGCPSGLSLPSIPAGSFNTRNTMTMRELSRISTK